MASVAAWVALIGAAAPAGAEETPGDASAEPSASAEEDENAARAEEAKREFGQGNSAYEEGKFEEAARAFERAHRISPHSAVLFNAARAWWKDGEFERAADRYMAAIRRGELSPDQLTRARSDLEKLREKLGWIVLRGAPDTKVTVGYHSSTPLPLVTHLAPGDHLLQISRGSESWTQLVSIKPGAPHSIVARPPKAASTRAAPPPPRTPDRSAARRRQLTWGWTTLSVGAGLGGAAAVTGALTWNAREQFDRVNDGTPENIGEAEARRDDARQLQVLTNVLAFSGAATAITGLTLILTSPRQSSTTDAAGTTSLALAPGRVLLMGRF